MYMSDYVEQLDLVLTSSNRKLLKGSGKISHDKAIEKARNEYQKYQVKTISPVEKEYLNSLKQIEGKSVIKKRNN